MNIETPCRCGSTDLKSQQIAGGPNDSLGPYQCFAVVCSLCKLIGPPVWSESLESGLQYATEIWDASYRVG